jgi:ribonuclease P protein component
VARNRAKRRLREAARMTLPELGRPGCDYVFIARAATGAHPWPVLLDDVRSALISLARLLDKEGPSGPADNDRAGPRPAKS